MKTGLQSLLVVPHTHSLGRGISFWLAHSRWVTQRKDSFNLLQQYSGVQACQKLQEEWWPCCWQPSNWVVESSSKGRICANKCGLTSRGVCWGTERGSAAGPQCWMLSEPGRAWVSPPAERDRAEVARSWWKATAEKTLFHWNQKQSEAGGLAALPKRGLCVLSMGLELSKLPRRWEMQELQALESVCPPLVIQSSRSAPRNHQHSQCCIAGIQRPGSLRTSRVGPCFSKASTKRQQSWRELHTGKHRQLSNTASA